MLKRMTVEAGDQDAGPWHDSEWDVLYCGRLALTSVNQNNSRIGIRIVLATYTFLLLVLLS